ncbi:MAG: 23S rRNA (adenine(2503)-C(2))-methyltransferase RlmN [Chlorobium phaeovibrioides]|nr:23S rRNA (adenine(2503)-C(2))-methyltransferase RlmN [Chlorobium phaeovibrioides]
MTTTLQNITDLTLQQLTRRMAEMKEPAWRAKQIHEWLFNHRAHSFDEMTTLSKALRERLRETFTITPPEVEKHDEATEGACPGPTEKLLLRLPDGAMIETVLIPGPGRLTACLSSQAGCALQCTFCATGTLGAGRNLTPGEIVGQANALNDMLAAPGQEQKITNIVFMGMGEPLLNTPNVLDAVETLSTRGYNMAISQRKITISTVGIIPEIAKLATSGMKTKLAVSLHSAFQEKRESLMPLAARRYPLEELQPVLAHYAKNTGEPITLVYMLLEGINDSMDDARQLIRFASGFFCKINLIDYNSIVNFQFKNVSSEKRERFRDRLLETGLQVTLRKSYGTTIHAACGQLAAKGMEHGNKS